jgi:hypothetical protein
VPPFTHTRVSDTPAALKADPDGGRYIVGQVADLGPVAGVAPVRRTG